MSDAEKYWAHEAECLRHAERAVDNGLRRKLEALARRWMSGPLARSLVPVVHGSD
jgi:hypothetical protein